MTEQERSPYEDLRQWLDNLRETGRLAVTKPGVPKRFVLAAIAKRLEGSSATYFPGADGHAMPVTAGVLGNRSWFAEAIGVEQGQLLERFCAAVEHPMPLNEIDRAQAPCQQEVFEDIDLQRLLPVPTHHEYDAGPYITAGLLIARDSRSGKQNVSVHRLQVTGPDRMGILILPRHLNAFFAEAEDAGQALPVSIVIGVDPITLMASQAMAPLGQDELEIASALRGRPLDVVKSMTNDILVPANAEIVIEGEILPEVREMEGPFGEFPRYYGPGSMRQVVKVNLITTRKNPIYHTIIAAGWENLLLGGVAREASILSHLKKVLPCVVDVHLTPGGQCRYHICIKMRKSEEGEPKNVIMAAFGAHYDIKQVIVVDEDVDIHDPRAVEWAVATRFQADKDLIVVSSALGSKLDPSSDGGISAKLGMDATIPLRNDGQYRVLSIPGEEDLDIDAWIDQPHAT